MSRQCVELICSESRSGREEEWHLFAAYVDRPELFDLDEAVEQAPTWREPRGADQSRLVRRYIVGRFEDRTLFAVITVPIYYLNGEYLQCNEYFKRVNAPAPVPPFVTPVAEKT